MRYPLQHCKCDCKFGPEAKFAMVVCVTASPLQTQMLGVLSIIDSNDTHWIRKRKRLVCGGPKCPI